MPSFSLFSFSCRLQLIVIYIWTWVVFVFGLGSLLSSGSIWDVDMAFLFFVYFVCILNMSFALPPSTFLCSLPCYYVPPLLLPCLPAYSPITYAFSLPPFCLPATSSLPLPAHTAHTPAHTATPFACTATAASALWDTCHHHTYYTPPSPTISDRRVWIFLLGRKDRTSPPVFASVFSHALVFYLVLRLPSC